MGGLQAFFDQLQDTSDQKVSLEDRLRSAFVGMVDHALMWWRVLMRQDTREGMNQARTSQAWLAQNLLRPHEVVGSLMYDDRLTVLKYSKRGLKVQKRLAGPNTSV